MTESARPIRRRRDLLHPERPAPQPQGPLTPDALAAEIRRQRFRRSPWDEWLDRYRGLAGDPSADQGDGGKASWEQDHPPRKAS